MAPGESGELFELLLFILVKALEYKALGLKHLTDCLRKAFITLNAVRGDWLNLSITGAAGLLA